MAKFTELEKAEGARLQSAIKAIETALVPGANVGANTSVLERLLVEMKLRAGILDQTEKESLAEEREENTLEILIARREAALNAAERKQFEEFLLCEFFTKSDFDELEAFYRKSWDKLSENGKAEMSHRVWEGVRRKEYEFSELPDIVREKEAERVRDQLTRPQIPTDLNRIPEKDREDFLNAWARGERGRAYEILNRPEFAKNVATSDVGVSAESVAAKGTEAKEMVKTQEAAENTDTTPAPERLAKELNLGDVQLVDDGGTQAVAPTVKSGASPVETPAIKR